MSKKISLAIGLVLLAAASIIAHLYVQSQVYYPVVRLDLPSSGLKIVAILPETKERKACGVANDRFIAPFKQSCKGCKITMARCERQLDGLEQAMHDGMPLEHPMVIAREVRLAVIGPAEKAKAGCEFLVADIVRKGMPTAICIPPQASARKS